MEPAEKKSEPGRNFDNQMFETNPNFQFQQEVKIKMEALGGSCNFETYLKNGKAYVIAGTEGENHTHSIEFFELPDFKSVKKLDGHKDLIMNMRYFQNPTNKKEYLVSADRRCNVIVWDLSPPINEEYKQVLDKPIKPEYDTFVYSCLMIFRGEKFFVVTSNIGGKNTFIYDQNGNQIHSIGSGDKNVYYLMYHKKVDNDYIIACAKNQVIIEAVPIDKEGNKQDSMKKTKNLELPKECPYNLGGLVFSKGDKDYLCVTNTYGNLFFYDITDMENIPEPQRLEQKEAQYLCITKWNDDYLLALISAEIKQLVAIDITGEKFEVISQVCYNEFDYERYFKKIVHPTYGEAIISVSGKNWNTKLWINKDIKIESGK